MKLSDLQFQTLLNLYNEFGYDELGKLSPKLVRAFYNKLFDKGY